MTFHVGQKIICVDARQNPYLTEGSIYTVKEVASWTFASGNRGIWVCEADQISGAPFYCFRFRPLVERQTSIEIFTAMLKPSKVNA